MTDTTPPGPPSPPIVLDNQRLREEVEQLSAALAAVTGSAREQVEEK